ncbi:MAG: hypothetical protein ACYC38_12145 [Eubacteriales bacterium]
MSPEKIKLGNNPLVLTVERPYYNAVIAAELPIPAEGTHWFEIIGGVRKAAEFPLHVLPAAWTFSLKNVAIFDKTISGIKKRIIISNYLQRGVNVRGDRKYLYGNRNKRVFGIKGRNNGQFIVRA